MREVNERDYIILPGVCDAAGKLSIPDAFCAFMDQAAIHAQALGVGLYDLAKRDCFWLTVKTKVLFYRRPKMGEICRLVTWPEAPQHLRCDRSYELRKGEELLIAGKTEWAVLNTKTGALTPIEEIYPTDLTFDRPSALSEPYVRVADRFEPTDKYGEYRVRSTDIDVGGHVNNVAYVRALLGSFSNAELKELNVKKMDVVFRTSCYEGDQLELSRRKTEAGLDLRMAKDGKAAILAHME